MTRPIGRCVCWRGLKTTVLVSRDCSSACRIAWPAASLTASGSARPSKPAQASAAASVAWTSSSDSSPRASKEGIPLFCCSMAPCLRGLGFFQQLSGTKLHLVDAALQERGPHEIAEQRVRPVRPGAELGVEQARHEPRVIGQLDALDQAPVRRKPAEDHPVLAHHLAVFIVELEAVTVTLLHDLLTVRLVRVRAGQELARV